MNLKDAAANLNQAHPEDILHPLYTPWGELLMRSGSYDDILSEYPRPQMRRTDYHMQNGLWEYAVVSPGTLFFHGRAFPKRGKYALHSAF